ncbi:hypothetical protein AWW66_19420 [Micromonospora rosaria]|uniref:DUF4352 domain-containing protein n=1 Tax=Micromonospora rosaria TaxID=47874 RepID=A0A136PPF0_9ACTN|nr:DUF4352 domain-containing protein [Micromonospora rosaria]KXK60345.1 hypothetical protein AWW66_19420 [Micromonospora rosaria]
MRKTTVVALSVTALVALGCGSAATDTADGATGDDTGAKTAEAKKVAAIGDPARDGKFEFTVKSTKCGVDKVGSDLLGATAQGQYCLVNLTVKNIGKEAQLLDGSSQKAYDAKGTEYSSDSEAGLYANKKAETFLNEINPGNQVTGVIVFDVPKKVKLTELKLHDSFLSNGVTVALS